MTGDRNDLAAQIKVLEACIADIGEQVSKAHEELDTGRAQVAKDRLRTLINRCAWLAPA